MIQSFPKILAVGSRGTERLFNGPVEITEKIDGSQFVFGKDSSGALRMRSKNKEIFPESVDKMFATAVEVVQGIDSSEIPDNTYFYCEYLQKPKHNVLAYDNVPRNNLALFGVSFWADGFRSSYAELGLWAERLGIDVAPMLLLGFTPDDTLSMLRNLLDTDSYLGGTKIEGVVIKNYDENIMIGGKVLPLLAGKYVSEAFKERMSENKKQFSGKGRWGDFADSYRTEARWRKAVQHLREDGQLGCEPQDIGKLIKEVYVDITNEEKETITDFLWKEFGNELLRRSVAGLPEWYKEQLAAGNMN